MGEVMKEFEKVDWLADMNDAIWWRKRRVYRIGYGLIQASKCF